MDENFQEELSINKSFFIGGVREMTNDQMFQTGGTVDMEWLNQLTNSTYPCTTASSSWTIPATSVGFQNCISSYDVTKIETLDERIASLESQIDYLMHMLKQILDRYTEEDVISLLDGIKKSKDDAYENNNHDDS